MIVSFLAMAVLLFLVFPNLPIGGEMLDVRPGYSHEEAKALMEQYGSSGRTIYAWSSMVLDTIFAMVYVTFFAGLIYRFRITEKLWILAFIPVVAGVWDLAENVQITAMLVQYPDVSVNQVTMASTFTKVKGWISPVYQILGIGLFLIALLRGIVRKIQRREGDE